MIFVPLLIASSNVGLVVYATKRLAGHKYVKESKRKLVRKTSLIAKEFLSSSLRDYQSYVSCSSNF